MGGIVSTISEMVFGPTIPAIQYSYQYPTENRLYPRRVSSIDSSRSTVQEQSPRPRRNIYNSSGSSYSKAASNSTSHNVALQTTYKPNITNEFYIFVRQQCSYEFNWQTSTDNLKLIELTNTSMCFKIKQDFSKYLRRENPTVIKIVQVQNNILMGQYLLKKAEYKSKGIYFGEHQYYHGTKEANVNTICSNNFDWRRTKRNLFGHGVSFAPKSSYAINYCDKRPNKTKVMFLAKVLVGKACVGSKNLSLPYDGFDTTMKEDGNVVVKYYDNEYYPEYIIFFNATIIPRNNNYSY